MCCPSLWPICGAVFKNVCVITQCKPPVVTVLGEYWEWETAEWSGEETCCTAGYF